MKNQELYKTILDSIRTNVPNFKPTNAISDWEPPPQILSRRSTPWQIYLDVGFIYPAYLKFTNQLNSLP